MVSDEGDVDCDKSPYQFKAELDMEVMVRIPLPRRSLLVMYGEARYQVWSLPSLKVSCQLSTNDLNKVSSVSLLMTNLTAFANEGLFELARGSSLTWSVLLSFAETTEETGCSEVERPKLWLYLVKF